MTPKISQVVAVIFRSSPVCCGVLKVLRAFVHKSILFGLAASLGAVVACSSNPHSTVRAVEVGNPEDSKPHKPKPSVPMRLVRVDLEATALEEISQLEFLIESVKLVDSSATGEGFLSSSPSTQAGAKLNLSAQSMLTLEFTVPEETVLKLTTLRLSFSFNPEAPGSVWVGSNQYQIEKQSKPLLLEINPPASGGAANAPLLMAGTISKAALFQPSTPSTSTSPGAASSSKPTPTVYRLK